MRVFILGGTGTIGTAIVAELVRRNHQVVALSRSEKSDKSLRVAGAVPCRGDMTEPEPWADVASTSDAVVQVAATFGDDMGDVDAKAMNALIEASQTRTEPMGLIYTGGCWLYGETGDEIAVEERPFDPLPAFSWMVNHAQMLLSAVNLRTAVIHPAMVYDMQDGGVFHRFVAAAKVGQRPEIWGSAATRWPLIESADLARAYCDLVERSDLVGHFNVVAEEGVTVSRITTVISEAFGSPEEPIIRSLDDAIAENGDWAKGPTLDQQMSARKLRSALGWQPETTDFAKPISRWIAGLGD
nr:NAD-dependent epimerase/dehydratase family protein [Phaeobacter sp.]